MPGTSSAYVALLVLVGCGEVDASPSLTADAGVREPCGDVSSQGAFFKTNRADALHDPIDMRLDPNEGRDESASRLTMSFDSGGRGDFMFLAPASVEQDFWMARVEDTFVVTPDRATFTFLARPGTNPRAVVECTRADGRWTLVISSSSDSNLPRRYRSAP